MNVTTRNHTRSLREDIKRLAGTMPAPDLCRKLGCSPGSLRTIASEVGVSIRFPGRPADSDRRGTDDRAVARIDATKPPTIELNGIIVSAEVAQKLTIEATERGTSLRALVAQLVSHIALDGITAAVLDER